MRNYIKETLNNSTTVRAEPVEAFLNQTITLRQALGERIIQRFLKIIRCWLLVVCLLPSTLLAAGALPEYVMKSAFLYNFALYTEWPESVNGHLNLCILGVDEFGLALDKIDGKEVKPGRRIVVRNITPEKVQQCHILYIGAKASEYAANNLAGLSELPILTISDTVFANNAIIHIWLENQRLLFVVNQPAAERARLSFSSKMLNLAKGVQ